MKSRFVFVGFAAALFLLVPGSAAAADIDWGIHAGIVLDGSDPLVGVEALTSITGRLMFNPNIEVVFADSTEIVLVNADAHYDFDLGDDRSWWLGAGLAG